MLPNIIFLLAIDFNIQLEISKNKANSNSNLDVRIFVSAKIRFLILTNQIVSANKFNFPFN